MLSTYKAQLRTILDTSSSIHYGNSSTDIQSAVDYLNSKAYLEAPLTINVPKFPPVEIGLAGSFFDPTDAPITGGAAAADGTCDQLGTTGLLAIHSSNLFGHKLIDQNALQSGSINLNINVIHTNPDGTYNGVGAAPDITTISSKNDWIGLDSAFFYSSVNSARLKTVSYLGASANVDGLIKVKVDPTDSATTRYYGPSIYPLVLEFKYSGTSSNGGCTSTGSCSGMYRAVIQSPGVSITANLVPTTGTANAPPLTISGTFNITDSSTNSSADTFTVITRADIARWDTLGKLSNTFNQPKTAILPGQIILFKTYSGNYEKMKVGTYTGSTNFETLNGQFVIFDSSGVPGALNTFSVSSTYSFSFDLNTTSCSGNCDIWWENVPPLKLVPLTTAKLGFYP